MRSTTARAAAVLAATAVTASGATAGDGFTQIDFTQSGWGAFLNEAFRSLDVVGFALLTLLVVLIGMCVDLVNHLRVNKLVPESLLADVQDEMSNGEYEKALERSQKSDSLIGQVFAAALSKTDYSFERMQEAMRGELKIQALVWRQWVGQLRLSALIGFLLGGMGAMLGVMRFISDLAGRPNVGLALASSFEMRALAYNIFTALFLGGLISVFSLVVHGVCSAKLEKILLEADRLGEELLDPFRPLPPPPEE